MNITAYKLAERFIGTKELTGIKDNNPVIMSMLQLDDKWPQSDEVPWCSGFINYICWLLRLPRSKSLAAVSWLNVGTVINFPDAKPGFDIVVLKSNIGHHVGFFSGVDSGILYLLGGNQANSVSVSGFNLKQVLGIRRLLSE